MATRKRAPASEAPGDTPGTGQSVKAIRHPSKRKNIPPAGLEAQGRVEETPRVRFEYNPHLPPVLRFADKPAAADRLPALLATARERALSEDEARVLADALRRHEPWLEWSGKRERPWFEVEPPALHIHERVSTQAMLRVLAREDVNRDLFADPQQSYAEAVQFYKYDVDWANRMILGDSLAVMASLARREDLAGKVQMIYIDPPYGISFKSNFQPQLGQRDVKDREQDLTREPEMVKAYRDTWTLGIHSYLAYLRDRLPMARELLTESGSVFVQISDENLHRVRAVMDEVFGPNQFIAQITYRTTSSLGSQFVGPSVNYLLWFAKNRDSIRFSSLFRPRGLEDDVGGRFTRALRPSGERHVFSTGEREDATELAKEARVYRHDNLTSQSGGAHSNFPIDFEGKSYVPSRGFLEKQPDGIRRLTKDERLAAPTPESLTYVRFIDDFPLSPLAEVWGDTQTGAFTESKIYVVQTNTKVIERCLLMTTDPGDLVLDPTCGSATTAFVAEKWGRRWITIDSSRVALALAKHRLMTASFEHFKLRKLSPEDLQRNPRGTWLRNGGPEPRTFDCKTVPHITLKSIARNTSLDPIFAKHEPVLADKLAALNRALSKAGAEVKDKLAAKLVRKHREEGSSAVSEADIRRWLLPGTHPAHLKEAKAARSSEGALKALTAKQVQAYRAAIPAVDWQPWQVPFDTDPDWPSPLAAALTDYRNAWRGKMDEVNRCIQANAEVEELVDQPLVEPGIVRVAGPFTMEGVIAHEQGLDDDSPIGGGPDALDSFGDEGGAGALGVVNAEAHLDKILRLLKASGVDFAGKVNKRFSRLEPMASSALLHAEGAWADDGERRVAVSVGPEAGNVTAFQVEDAVRSANRMGYDEVVFAGFGFDAAAQAAIDESGHPKLHLHMALIRPDVAMGDLLKTQPGSQLFMVFSAPRVKPPQRLADGQFTVEVEGMDVYDPVSNALFPTSRDRVAAWFVDTDYDGRTFCICQAFFPDRKKWDKLARALGDRGVVDEGRFDALAGWECLPFARPTRLPANAPWRVAVKVIDPRGNEGLRVLTMAST